MRQDDVSNFEIVLFADGLDGPIQVSPEGDAGGFNLAIYQCDGGYPSVAFEIAGRKEGNELVTEVKNRNGLVVAKNVTVC